MRKFDKAAAESKVVGPIDVTRWEQFGLNAAVPFQAMWYTVPPLSASVLDRHPELELSIVISGAADVESIESGSFTPVVAGDGFLFDTEEGHIIHNRSETEPVTIFAAYWMPTGTPLDGPAEKLEEAAQ
ncbi:cupin domain-containing protein [Longispora albida]|uniref:cupin domain-containing protein n=1 Tax=Longispora albida TaxID=203523 RepID=UPI000364B39A|nr:cupin domain-containing protein [Longispora albida]